MTEQTGKTEIERLKPLVGTWEMEVAFPGAPPMGGATTTFEWMPGGLLLVQRWQIPIPEAPDGMAVSWEAAVAVRWAESRKARC